MRYDGRGEIARKIHTRNIKLFACKNSEEARIKKLKEVVDAFNKHKTKN